MRASCMATDVEWVASLFYDGHLYRSTSYSDAALSPRRRCEQVVLYFGREHDDEDADYAFYRWAVRERQRFTVGLDYGGRQVGSIEIDAATPRTQDAATTVFATSFVSCQDAAADDAAADVTLRVHMGAWAPVRVEFSMDSGALRMLLQTLNKDVTAG